MMKGTLKRIVVVGIIAVILLIVLGNVLKDKYWMFMPGGNVRDVSIDIGSPKSYTEEEVKEAAEALKSIFAKEFDRSKLIKICYDEERTAIFLNELTTQGTVYGWSPRYHMEVIQKKDPGEVQKVIIFITDFKDSRVDYGDYQIMLVKGTPDKGWQICWGGCGYG